MRVSTQVKALALAGTALVVVGAGHADAAQSVSGHGLQKSCPAAGFTVGLAPKSLWNRFLGHTTGRSPMVITGISPGSPASHKDIRRGDQLFGVQRIRVTPAHWGEIAAAEAAVKENCGVLHLDLRRPAWIGGTMIHRRVQLTPRP